MDDCFRLLQCDPCLPLLSASMAITVLDNICSWQAVACTKKNNKFLKTGIIHQICVNLWESFLGLTCFSFTQFNVSGACTQALIQCDLVKVANRQFLRFTLWVMLIAHFNGYISYELCFPYAILCTVGHENESWVWSSQNDSILSIWHVSITGQTNNPMTSCGFVFGILLWGKVIWLASLPIIILIVNTL